MIPADAVKYEIVRYTRGRGLEINVPDGEFSLFKHFTAADETDVQYFMSNKLKYVVSHDLRDLPIQELWRVVEPGGHLVFCTIHNFSKEMHELSGWDFVYADTVDFVNDEGADKKYLQVFKKIGGEDQRISWNLKKPEKTCMIVRYGAFGDMIQLSSVLPGLKEQGYHITIMGYESSRNILLHDPHVDDWYIVDKDQVPNVELDYFWDWVSRGYDKFINLSESVEGSLLTLPGRVENNWPQNVRHMRFDVNYSEFTHLLAEVPFPPFRQKFYATEHELRKARHARKKMGKRVIHYVMAGSSVHKTWPWMDALFARILLKYNDVSIVASGDRLCEVLISDWRKEPRVINWANHPIRDTLTFAINEADLVIGPETGVMNAVGMEPVPKIFFLSHGSIENISKHWVNTTNLEPEDCDCFPCHRLHHSFTFCNRDEETGSSLCTTNISPDRVMKAIKEVFNGD